MFKKKRFYKTAAATESEDGFLIALDGRTVRTPAGMPLLLATRTLAEAIAQEWLDQEEEIRPHTMPMTQIASTAIDRVDPRRAAVIGELIEYSGTDLLCYQANDPKDLVERQRQVWQPILDWVEALLDVEFLVTDGIMPIVQSPATLAKIEAWLERQNSFRLTGIHVASAAMGSLILAIALAEGRIDAAEGFAISQLDETYEIERWGEDEEAAVRRETLRKDIVAAHRFLGLGPVA